MIYRLKFLFESFENFVKNLYDTFISLIKVIVLSKFNVKLPSINKKECVVLGNGPSLRKVIEEKEEFLKNSVLFCVNYFPSTPEYEQLRPQNCVFLDQGFYLKDAVNAHPRVAQTIDCIIDNTHWQLNLFIPSLAKDSKCFTEIPLKNSNVKIFYYNYTVVKGFAFIRHFLFKANLGMPLCQNVLGACIFLALNMGYKKMYLLGAEHSWPQSLIVGENNELFFKHFHFYDEKEKPLVTQIYKSPLTQEKMYISEYFKACVKTFEAYYVLEKYAVNLKVKIFNATEGSYIDAFERKKYNSL